MKRHYIFKNLIFSILFLFSGTGINYSQTTYCTSADEQRFAGTSDNYRYELWNQYGQGTGCMTVDSGALFSGNWSGIQNYLARRGLGYNQTKEHQDIGWFYSNYTCTYSPSSASGNSYLAIYGWTTTPLVEFYIIEDWRNWIPSKDPAAKFKGTITVNGGTYDIYQNTRIKQPTILGYNADFEQYFSIRRTKRNSGSINISDHFNKWESLGMDMGKMYEVSFVVEGYQSSGNFNFSSLDITVHQNPLSVPEEDIQTKGIDMFPNPAKEILYIHDAEGAVVQIYNMQGQAIKEKQLLSSQETIPVSDLSSGSYFIRMVSENRVYKDIFIVEN